MLEDRNQSNTEQRRRTSKASERTNQQPDMGRRLRRSSRRVLLGVVAAVQATLRSAITTLHALHMFSPRKPRCVRLLTPSPYVAQAE
jgi:hypothetical protein